MSASLATGKLSRPPQTFTSRLLEKNPPSVIPTSRKPLGVNRDFALGFSSFLNKGKIAGGMVPREVAVGGGWGGSAVGGGWVLGLNVAFRRRPNAYASGAACSILTS